VGLVADRSRNKITEFNLACFQTDVIAYRCAGETLGSMYGYRWIQNAGELPAAAQGRAGEFARNDEGLLVYVGPGNSFTDGQGKQLWGTSTTIGGANYGWGMPISLKDASGSPQVVKMGDGNPDFHFGLSNNVSWRDFSFFALLDWQKGGNVYNQTNQRMYQWARSADVDQTGKPQELKKPIDYYAALYAANDPSDYFVEPAGFVKLREASVRYKLSQRALAPFGKLGARGVTLGIVGRNLWTHTKYGGYDPEVFRGNDLDNPGNGTPASPSTRLDSFGYPRYRTFTGSVQVEF
jgi:hypothetical protein